jgi:hypothetical protein
MGLSCSSLANSGSCQASWQGADTVALLADTVALLADTVALLANEVALLADEVAVGADSGRHEPTGGDTDGQCLTRPKSDKRG